MKKIVLLALFIAAAATSAFAHSEPQRNKVYFCDYTNYSGAAKDPGLSWWERRTGSTTELLYTIEHFQLPSGTSWDGYKANWSNPRTNYYGITTWDFRFKDGPLCTNTVVTPGGFTISFQGCSDGHTRYCYTQ